jgi:hypothetical protein
MEGGLGILPSMDGDRLVFDAGVLSGAPSVEWAVEWEDEPEEGAAPAGSHPVTSLYTDSFNCYS